MSYFESLKYTIKTEVETGRIGSPVFLRFVAQVASDCDELRPILCKALNLAEVCLAASPKQVYVLGGFESGHISAIVKYEEGQSAIVSVAVSAKCSRRIDLTLIGNRGSLYHEDSVEQECICSEAISPIEPMMDAVDQSLERCEPVFITGLPRNTNE